MRQLKIITEKLLLLNKITHVVLILIISFNTTFSQVNLVTNPSFENISSCPSDKYQIRNAIGWDTLKNGGGGTPDIYHTCCPNNLTTGECCVPSGPGQAFQYPKTGNAFVGIVTYSPTAPNIMREYIQSKLNNKLINSHSYAVTFYVNFKNNNKIYCNSIGAYLDSGNVNAPPFGYYGLASVSPQIQNTTKQLNDTLSWIKIQGCFVATGIEEYITIGNFLNDAASDGYTFNSSNLYVTSYYYIDDISVIDVSLPAYAGNDTSILSGDSAFIGRTPEIGLNDDCIWFVNNQPIDTIAGLWVKPTIPTTYVLQQTICGNVNYDTVRVNVSALGVNEIKIGTVITLYPNPAAGSFMISINSSVKIDKVEVTIKNVAGKLISSSILGCANNQCLYDKILENGVYFVSTKVVGSNNINTSKLIIIK